MKIKIYVLGLCGMVCSAPAQAQAPISEADFEKALSGIPFQAAAGPALPLTPESYSLPLSGKDAISAQLDEWLGIFDGLERQPALNLQAVTREVIGGLGSGAYTGVIMGESHGIPAEIAYGIGLTKEILAARGIGAFSREREIFPDAEFLTAQGVPVLTFKNQFKPEPDVQAGLQAAGRKLLVTYTGHAHTSIRLKNYFLYTLLEGKPFGYGPGGKDMVTVEDAFLKAGKQPVIVAMVTETRVLRRIEQMFLRKLAGDNGVSGADLSAGLKLVRELWEQKVAGYPVRAEDIYFVRSPEQANLLVGITPGERRPLALDAVSQALALPEFGAWLGTDKIKLVEALWGSDENGVSWRVVAHKFSGDTFEHVVRRRNL